MAVGVLGGKRGTLAVLVYVLLGAVGVPVFAGFSGGIGALLGNAGGYIIGFIFSALVMWAIEHVFGRKPVVQIISMIVGLIVCYAFGTAWFMFAYTRSTGPVGLMAVLGWCVFPFIIPDLIKIALAYMSCFILFTLLAKPIAKLLRLNEDDSLVFTRSVAYPNNGFVGIPLCTAVFGTEGTVLGSLSVPCATLYMFLFIMQSFRREKDHNLKQQLKSMLTPMNISAVLMIIMLATGWKFTGAPLQFLSSLANCVLPTSMIIIGCLLSGSPLIDVLKKPILYFITLLRGVVMPLVAAVLLRFTGWDRTTCLCIVMVLGCSVATVISIFGVRYDRSPEMASKSVLQSNLLLPVTMPLMMFIAERIL